MDRRQFLIGGALALAGGAAVVEMTARRMLLASGAGPLTSTVPAVPTAALLHAAPEGGAGWSLNNAHYYGGQTFYGYINSDGDVTARAFDNATRTVSGTYPRLYGAMEYDDHDNPALLIRDSDKRLMYFYTRHGGPQVYLSVSTNPADHTSFAARVDLDSQLGGSQYTYPTVVQLLDETNDPIYLFYRADSGDVDTTAMLFSKSTDGGATWAAQTLLYRDAGRSSYWRISSNGHDRIDFAVADGSPVYDTDMAIGHFYYQGGSFFQTDGTPIVASLPFSHADISEVRAADGDGVWMWDMWFDGERPYILYDDLVSDSDHHYRYAVWSGSAWNDTEIVAAGTYVATAAISGVLSINFAGGCVIDQADPRIVYASVQTGSGRWDMFRFVTLDGGATFTSDILTSSGKHIRPVMVRDHSPELVVTWAEGSYPNYLGYDVGQWGAGS